MAEEQILKLKRLQRVISDMQTNRARLEGKREQLLADLKARFGVSDLDGARKKFVELEKELKTAEKEIGLVIEKMEKIIEISEG